VATALAVGCRLPCTEVLVLVTLTQGLKITEEAFEEAEFPRHVQRRAEPAGASLLPQPRLPGALSLGEALEMRVSRFLRDWERCLSNNR